jgi:hypothetical protein
MSSSREDAAFALASEKSTRENAIGYQSAARVVCYDFATRL